MLSHGTSYPYVRQLSVAIDDVVSATHIINCSVREGSVAEPFMFPNYTARTGRVLQHWNYEISWRYSVVSCKNQLQLLEDCIRAVKAWTDYFWMMLKLKYLFVSRFMKNSTSITTIHVGDSVADIASSEVRNLSVLMDQHMTFSSNLNIVCRSACLTVSKMFKFIIVVVVNGRRHLRHNYHRY